MRTIDSGALVGIGKALGLSGGGAQTAQLDDALVNQTFAVDQVARRARTFGDGLYHMVLRLSHGAGASDEVASLDPYEAANTQNAFPSPVPDDYDLFLVGAGLEHVGGTAGNLDDAMLGLQSPIGVFAAGIDQAGSPLNQRAVVVPIGMWTGGLADAGSAFFGVVQPFMHFRIPRGSTLVARSGAAGSVTIEIAVLVGIFPKSLGQDAST